MEDDNRSPRSRATPNMSRSKTTRRELERRAEYEARPEVRAKRKQDAEVDARRAAERAAAKGRLVTSTDYPWLKPGWKW
jgi:hypothetical protein